MVTLIIFQSVHHSNTEKVAKAMADSLGCDTIRAGELGDRSVEDYDLVGFGSGIFYGKHHRSILDFAEKLVGNPGGRAFVFSTAGFSMKRNHNHLKRILSKRGYDIVDEFSCKGHDSWGPYKFIGGINKRRPNDKDLENAREFAQRLK